MLQNTQTSFYKNQDIRIVTPMISEKETQCAYLQSTQELAADLYGELVLPDTPDYESARGVWDATADHHPALIVRPVNVADVITAVNFAREQDMDVSVRSGGHSMAGYGTNDGGLVIDLSQMKSITVDPERRIARIEPGLTWGEVATTLQPYGLALTSGDVSTVGVGGLLLGGGIGWMVRKYGLTIDRVRAIELVTSDGKLLRASAEENTELFWGLRGGGGNFGVATAFEVNLHPAGMVLGGAVFYDTAEAEDIMRAYVRYATTAPDELTTMATFMAAPPAPFIPQDMQGRPCFVIQVCYTGDLTQGEQVVAPLRTLGTPIADVIAPMPYPAMFAMTEHATVPGLQHSIRSLFLRTLSDDVIHRIVEEATAIISPMTLVQVRVLGGAMSRVAVDATAFAHRDKQALVLAISIAPAAIDNELGRARIEQIWQALQPYANGVYVNFLSNEGEWRIHEAYPPATYARLAALKRIIDPTNLFHLNQNIAPAGTGLLAA